MKTPFSRLTYSQEQSKSELFVLIVFRLDNKIIRVDWDVGIKEGREYGRGINGGQVREERNEERKKMQENSLALTQDMNGGGVKTEGGGQGGGGFGGY